MIKLLLLAVSTFWLPRWLQVRGEPPEVTLWVARAGWLLVAAGMARALALMVAGAALF